jgi:hypothetical protein
MAAGAGCGRSLGWVPQQPVSKIAFLKGSTGSGETAEHDLPNEPRGFGARKPGVQSGALGVQNGNPG